MRITRNTMRADGLTVGEAMDRDAAFLRSIGIDAKDGQKTRDEREEEFIDEFEKKILDAMDEVIGGLGWLDGDLNDLLPTIQAHAKKLFDRREDFRCGLVDKDLTVTKN